MRILLAVFAFYEGLVFLFAPSSLSSVRWHAVGMIGIGILLVVMVSRGFGRLRPRVRRDAQGPSFTPDDPEVADLPPTTTGQLSEQIRQVRERQKRAQD